MAKASFVPNSDARRRPWLNTLADRLLQTTTPNLALKYGISTLLVTQLDNGRKWVNWTYDNLTGLRNGSKGLTAFKDNLFFGKGAAGNLTAPTLLAFSATPNNTGIAIIPVADVFGLAASIGHTIKSSLIYDPADGELCGLEGAEETLPDEATTKPDLAKSHVASGGRAEIVWVKGPFSAIKIQVDRNDTQGVRDLATDTEPDYVDTVRPAAGQTAIYKYRAIYMLGDAEYGQWSDWVEITMRG